MSIASKIGLMYSMACSRDAAYRPFRESKLGELLDRHEVFKAADLGDQE